MRNNTISLIFRPIIRPKFPAFYLSDTSTKSRKEIKNKRISILGVSWPNLSTDVSFTGIDFGRKKKFGLVTSATKKILKTGFHRAKEHFELHFSANHSAEISGILHFQSILHFRSRHEKPERDKNKRISFLCVTLPNISTDVRRTEGR